MSADAEKLVVTAAPAKARAVAPARPAEPEVDEPSPRMQLRMLRKIGPAMATVVACVAATYFVPQLQFARPWTPEDPLPFWNVIGRPLEAGQLEETEARVAEVEALADEVLADQDEEPAHVERDVSARAAPREHDDPLAYVPQPGDDKPAPQSLELFTGNELDPFFAKLALSDAGVDDAITRVVHWGDSAIGLDGIPGAIRVRMQNRFGNAGHGWHLMSPPNTSYLHREVKFRHNGQWDSCFIIMRCKNDGRYGLGGLTSWSNGGAQSSFAPHATRSSGDVARFELFYHAAPHGGRIRIRVDDEEKEIIDTNAEAPEDRVWSIDLPQGPHELEVRAIGHGRARVYGVVMERDRPGVVWDSMEMVGAFTNRLSAFDPDHLRSQLEHRKSDLAVFTYGGNDMIRDMKMSTYVEEYRRVIQKVKEAKPGIACLVMAPLDHGERKGVRIISRPIVAEMVQAQRETAQAEGCAFFDTWTAMGGEGSAGRWFKREPKLMGGDLGHATSKGHQVIGELFYRALLEAYVAYRKRGEE